MLRISMKNGETINWQPDAFTDYTYDGKAFIVIKDKRVVGIYNFECVSDVHYIPDRPAPAQEANA